MTTRTTTAVVTFRSSFTLSGWAESWPGGDYAVTTDEELLDTSFPAYRRVSTTIALPKGAVTRYITIDPIELASALERDQASHIATQVAVLGSATRPPDDTHDLLLQYGASLWWTKQEDNVLTDRQGQLMTYRRSQRRLAT